MSSGVQERQYRSFDFLLVFMIVVLAICGIVVLGSATRSQEAGSLYAKQRLWLASGLLLMAAAAFVDYHFICKFYIIIYILNVVMLVAIFFLVDPITNTVRWFGVGTQSIQPSEFTKVFLIIFLARFIEKKGDKINTILNFLFLLFLAVLPIGLVYLQPSLSASVVIFVIAAAVIFAGNIRYRNIAVLLIFTAPLITFLYTDFIGDRTLIGYLEEKDILQTYQIRRIDEMIDPTLNPDNYRQLEGSIHAIGGGGLYGKGLYNGTHGQETAESENDFIFAVLGEEFGFVGCAFIIILAFLIVLKCLHIAANAADMSGRLIAVGVAAMFFFQSFFHVGVTTGLMPVTGVTFPFFSYGGSSMWACMIAAGLVINVGMTKSRSMFG